MPPRRKGSRTVANRKTESNNASSSDDDIKQTHQMQFSEHDHSKMMVDELRTALSYTPYALDHDLDKLKKPALLRLYNEHLNRPRSMFKNHPASHQHMRVLLYEMAFHLRVENLPRTVHSLPNSELCYKLGDRFKELEDQFR